MTRFNGTMSATNYGSKQISVERLGHGITFRADGDTTRMGRSYYAKAVVASPFEVTLVFPDHAEYADFAEWLRGYGDRCSMGTVQVGPMRVVVASRKFDKTGIPTTGVTFGDARTSVLYRMNLTFAGAPDPIGALGAGETAVAAVSQFSMPADETLTLPHFYPGGIQLSGADQGDDLLYDRGVVGPQALQNEIDMNEADTAAFTQNQGK